MTSILFALVSFILLQPIERAITDQLARAEAPRAVVEQVVACTRQAAPAALDRVSEDPVWAVSTVLGLWWGDEDAGSVLAEVAPACDAALQAARPFLRAGAA
jgi:hypothetical protein